MPSMPSIDVKPSELANRSFVLKYDVVRNQYTRPNDLDILLNSPIADDWSSLANNYKGVFRRVEPNWRAFLTSEGQGELSWKIGHQGAVVKEVEVLMTGWATFRSGRVGAFLVSGGKSDEIPEANEPYLATKTADKVWGLNREPVIEKLRLTNVGRTDFTELKINFSDVTANAGLDHDLDDSQVFRTPLDNPRDDNLVIKIVFDEGDNPDYAKVEDLTTLADQVENIVSNEPNQEKILHVLHILFILSERQRQYLVNLIKTKYGRELFLEFKKYISGRYEQIIVTKIRPAGEVYREETLELMQIHSNTAKPLSNAKLSVNTLELYAANTFLLSYDVVRDQYTRPFALNAPTVINGWQNLVQSLSGVSRQLDKGAEEWAFLGSDGGDGEIVWRVDHPGARVSRVEALLSGMSTYDDGKIGVELSCGEHCTRRPPAQIPYDASRTDIMEISNIGDADHTEVRVQFQDKGASRPSQLFRIFVTDSPTADDFVLRIEFEPTIAALTLPNKEAIETLVDRLHEKLLIITTVTDARTLVVEILIELAKLSYEERWIIIRAIKKKYNCDLVELLKKSLPPQQLEIVESVVNAKTIPNMGGIKIHDVQVPPPKVYPELETVPPQQHITQVSVSPTQNITQIMKETKEPALLAEALHNGINDPNVSAEEILRILTIYSITQRIEIIHFYKQKYPGKDFIKDLKAKKMSSGDEKILEQLSQAILLSPAQFDAQQLHKAFKGLGTTESILIEILTTRTPLQIAEIKQAYKEEYGKELMEDISGDTSGTFKTVLLLLLEGERDQSNMVDPTLAQKEAQKLSGEEPSKDFIDVLTSRNFAQLRRIFDEYQKLTGRPIEETIAADFGGDVRDTLLAIVKYARNPQGLFVEWLHDSMKGRGARENDLIRLIISRSSVDLGAINMEFKYRFAVTLEQAIGSNTSAGLLRALLVYIIRNYNTFPDKQEEYVQKPHPLTAPFFDRNKSVERVQQAISDPKNVNTSQLIKVLFFLTSEQRQEVVRLYKLKYSVDLVANLKKALSGDFLELLLALLEHPNSAYYDAQLLHKAMKGIGTDEQVLIEILTTRPNEEIQAIKLVYSELFKRTLEEDIGGDTSGNFKKLLLSLCAANRDYSYEINPAKAVQDAQSLYKAGEKVLGTNEDVFIALMTRENFAQLQLMFDEYEKLTKHPIEKAIEGEFSGDIKNALLMIVKMIRGTPGTWADWMQEALKAKKSSAIIRLFVTSLERYFDLWDIARKFEEHFGVTLEKTVSTSFKSGPFRDALLTLVTGIAPIVEGSPEHEHIKLITVHPQQEQSLHHFDPAKLAELLHKAIGHGSGGGGGGITKWFKKGNKADVAQILQILSPWDFVQRQQIAQAYKKRYESKELSEVIKKELPNEPTKDMILALLATHEANDAQYLHKAMAGLGTWEHVLIEILTTRSNAQLQAIKRVYGDLYKGHQLEADIVGDTSGAFKRILVNLCAANRDESYNINQQKAEQDARSLYTAGEKKLGTDEDTFIALLTRENFMQLRQLFDEYQKLSGHTIEKAVAAEFSGDMKDVILAIVKSARNRSAFFAEMIHNAIHNGKKESDLIRLIISRSGIDLGEITNEYAKIFGAPMDQTILSEFKGESKPGLLALIKST